MSVQKADDQVQFDIGYDANNQPYVISSKDREKKLGDTAADTIVESISNAYERSMGEILKDQNKIVKKFHSIKLKSIFFVKDYLIYLKEERGQYGDDGIKDHFIAAGQTMAGYILGAAAGVGGGAVGGIVGSAIPVAGNAVGAWFGAVSSATTVSVSFDNVDIFSKPLKDHIGDLIAFITSKDRRRKFDYAEIKKNTAEGIKIQQSVKEHNQAIQKAWAETLSLTNLNQDQTNHPNFDEKYSDYLVYSKFDQINQCYSLCGNSNNFQDQDYNKLGYSIPFWKVKNSVEKNSYADIQFICSTYENKSILQKSENLCYSTSCYGGSLRPRIYDNLCHKNLELFSLIINQFEKHDDKCSSELYLGLINQYDLIAAYNDRLKNKFLDEKYEVERHYNIIHSFLSCRSIHKNSLELYFGLIKHDISINNDNIYWCIKELEDSKSYSNLTIYKSHQELLVHLLSNYEFNAYTQEHYRDSLYYTIGVEPYGLKIANLLISCGAKVEEYNIYNAISVIKKCTDNENTLSLINLFIKNKPKDLEYIDIFLHMLDKVNNLDEDKPECILDIYLGIIRNFQLIKFVNKIIKLKKETDIGYRLKKFLDCEFFSSLIMTEANHRFPISKKENHKYKEDIFVKLYHSLIDMGIKFTQKNIENCIPRLALHQDILEIILEKNTYDGSKLKLLAYAGDPDPENILMHLTQKNYNKSIIHNLIKSGAKSNAEAIYNAIKHYDSMVINDIIEALPNKLNTNGKYEYVVSGGEAITTALSRICKYLDVAKNLYCTSGNIHGFPDFQLPTTSYGSHGISYYREYFFHNGNCNSPIYNEESEYINSALLEIINILNLLFDYGLKAEEGMRPSYMYIELSKAHRIHVLGNSIPLYDLSEYSEKILDLVLEHYDPELMDLSYTILRCLYSSNKCMNFFTKTLNKFSLTGSIGQLEQILVSSSKEDDSCVNEENRLFMVGKILDKFISQYSFNKENKSEIIDYISSFMLLAFKESNIIVEEYIKKYFLSYLAKGDQQISKDLVSEYLLLHLKSGQYYIDEICSISQCNINFFSSFSEDYFTESVFKDIIVSPLELAIINNDYKLVKSLINNGANVNLYNSKNLSSYVGDITKYQNLTWIFNTDFYKSSNKEENSVIKIKDYYKSYLLYKEGADIIGCFFQADIITIAIKHNNLDMVSFLLNNDLNINKCGYNYICFNKEINPFVAIELQENNIEECISPITLSKEICTQTANCSIYNYLLEYLSNKENISSHHDEL